jgi:hypothetical protein
MPLRRIRLELARTREFPEGSSRHGYEFVAPLDRSGALDPAAWKISRHACTVVRFWGDTAHEHGTLIHRRDGKWVFSYEPGDEDDEPVFRLDRHRFIVGEYVSVTEHDGVTRTFRIVAVEPPIALSGTSPRPGDGKAPQRKAAPPLHRPRRHARSPSRPS